MFYVDDDIDAEDRYSLQKFLEYNEKGDFHTINSVFMTELKELPLQSYITSKDERPDLAAYNIYGDTQFAWVLMIYNHCFDFTDGTFSCGSQIRYPAMEDLEKIIFTLKARKRAQQSETGEL
jgi:hypothetical protein